MCCKILIERLKHGVTVYSPIGSNREKTCHVRGQDRPFSKEDSIEISIKTVGQRARSNANLSRLCNTR
jgi:hypothetical protein